MTTDFEKEFCNILRKIVFLFMKEQKKGFSKFFVFYKTKTKDVNVFNHFI